MNDSYVKYCGGVGLGLSIVKRLTDFMGGEITVHSVLGQGTVMRVTLPFKTTSKPSDQSILQEVVTTATKKLTILLAEDDSISQFGLSVLLQKDGHCVLAVDDGAQALQRLGGQDVDLIIMDIQMPRTDGLEVIRAIRSATIPRVDPNIPIIAMTAYAMAGDREKFLAAGMDDYIAKPVEIEELRNVIDRVMTAKRKDVGGTSGMAPLSHSG